MTKGQCDIQYWYVPCLLTFFFCCVHKRELSLWKGRLPFDVLEPWKWPVVVNIATRLVVMKDPS